MKNANCKTAGFVCAVLVTALMTSQALAQRTPTPRRVTLEKHKRGYTVYTPPGLEEGKRYPAVIWLHPKDDTMNARFRRDWWTDLKQRKIFMVFPESAQAGTWNDNDLPYLLDLAGDPGNLLPTGMTFGVDGQSELGITANASVAAPATATSTMPNGAFFFTSMPHGGDNLWDLSGTQYPSTVTATPSRFPITSARPAEMLIV